MKLGKNKTEEQNEQMQESKKPIKYNKKKLILLGLVMLILIGVSSVVLREKKEEREREALHNFFNASNMVGLWEAEGYDWKFLVYPTDTNAFHIRTNLFFDPYTGEGMFDEELAYRETSSNGLLFTASSGDKVSLYPLKEIGENRDCFEVKFTYSCDGDEIVNDEDLWDNHMIIHKNPNFSIDGLGGNYFMNDNDFGGEGMQQIIRMLNAECSNFYGTDVSVMDMEIDPNIRRYYNQPVGFDGYISGTARIQSVYNGSFVMDGVADKVFFKIDPITGTFYKLNAQRDGWIIWNYLRA